MKDASSNAGDGNQTLAFDGASVTLRASVERIISAFGKTDSELIQVVIESAEPLYREIRIRNAFQDANGNIITLQPDSELEITIKARAGKVER
jgi:hypothetical protein